MPFEQIAGSRLYAADFGSGEPILLLHGISNFNRAWAPQVEALVDAGYRVIIPDLPGHGASDPRTGETAVEDMAEAMLALLDSKGIERADVCGISLGGMVAMTMALRAPGRVRRIVACDTAARFDTDFHQTMVAGWKAIFLEEDGPMTRLGRTVHLLVNEAFRESLAGQRIYEEWLVNARHASGTSYAFVCDGLVRFNIEDELGLISQPTLILVGSEDKMLTPAVNKAIADRIPGAIFEQIEGAAHLANVDTAAVFNDALLSFLGRRS
jgi:3-oxoadipate enol-lactonase